MYAVIRTGGKQHRVQIGDVVRVDRLRVGRVARVDVEHVQPLAGQFDGLRVPFCPEEQEIAAVHRSHSLTLPFASAGQAFLDDGDSRQDLFVQHPHVPAGFLVALPDLFA